MKQTFTHSEQSAARPLQGLLPSMTPLRARLTRLMADARLASRLAYTAGVKQLRFASDNPPGGHTLKNLPYGSLRVLHETGATPVWFELTPYPALEIVAASQPPATDEAATALYSAVAETLLTPAVQKLQASGLQNAAFDSFAQYNANEITRERFVRFRCYIDAAESALNHELFFGLAADQLDTALLSLFEALLASERIPLRASFAALRIPGHALLGLQSVKIGVLQNLKPGDILLNGITPHYQTLLTPHPETVALELFWGTSGMKALTVTGSLTDQTLTLQETPVMLQQIAPSTAAAGDLETPTDLSQLEMPVRLEIDTLNLSLAQLNALQPGYVLELPIPLAEATVRLVTHGQTIGLGEMVAVGEHIGIRITQMAEVDDATH
ncbi:type III secretion system cytoplasmic ring protein SctQ [Mycoavidus sp. B2-EB]|uniref:type III secretion system cytoplasmic ring protein SctQ n=1 Tax=Mycoavidus sp. B2-EB TaxID=2651972 RepID=UPI001624936B|nr:type III secretion system cytoplasmic ring protein SctQ [Mycoavidus sp. B2-EB]BBO59491.1 type III secretion-associated protein [Mycoavidus sp. B2-EB]